MDKNQNQIYLDHTSHIMKKVRNFLILVSAIGYGLHCIVFAPLFYVLSANVSYSQLFITDLLSFATDLTELCVVFVTYGVLLFAVWRGGVKQSAPVWITAGLMVVLKYSLNFIMSCIDEGKIPSPSIFFEDDLPLILPNFFMEIFQYALLIFMAYMIIRSKKRKFHEAILLNEIQPATERALAFPMVKLLSFKNPLQKTAFFYAIIYFVARVFTLAVTRLTEIVMAHQIEDIAFLITDIAVQLVVAALCYICMVLVVSSFDKKEMNLLAEASEESST
ncbi:MAG: hypothetical protein E7645_06385 [Ruminococcaceae bacterium]|nr:hypothetical protein [Oscillospiraceae bacterium]